MINKNVPENMKSLWSTMTLIQKNKKILFKKKFQLEKVKSIPLISINEINPLQSDIQRVKKFRLVKNKLTVKPVLDNFILRSDSKKLINK